MYITLKIDRTDLLKMLVNRVEDWEIDEKVINMYQSMYENQIDNGYVDNIELDLMEIVDKDYINNCVIIEKGDSDFEEIKKDFEDDSAYDYIIEAVDNVINPSMFLVRYN